MDALNMPLEMIAVCSPEGELSPARFRLETESGERITVRIRQIRRREEIRLMGVESIRFDCLALLGGRLRRFELRYGRPPPVGVSFPFIRTCDKFCNL